MDVRSENIHLLLMFIALFNVLIYTLSTAPDGNAGEEGKGSGVWGGVGWVGV